MVMRCLHFCIPEPTMHDLNKIVVPRIKSEWENVAFAMKYPLYIISAIEKESHNDLLVCCQKLFKDWLTTNHGPSPKTWKTLLESIEGVEELTAALEEIKTELVKGLWLSLAQVHADWYNRSLTIRLGHAVLTASSNKN